MMYWLRRRIHPTWHFTILCIGVVLGVALAARIDAFWQSGWLVVALVVAATALYGRWRVLLVASLLAGMLFGLWRGDMSRANLTVFHDMYGRHVQVRGTVASDVEIGIRGQTVLRINNLHDHTGRSLPGVLRISTLDKRAIKRGDQVVADGKLQEGFGTLAATMGDARLVEVTRVAGGDPALEVRDSFSEAISRAVADPAASLGVGYLLGQKQALPRHLQDALVITGLTHVVVASGYNLTILVRLARRLFARVSKYLAALASIVMIGSFVAVTGLSPSMTRAGLVSMLGIWAWYYGRMFHPATLLAATASVTVLWNPSYAWGDVGWLLSFAAFAGVMIVAPLLRAYFYGRQKPSFIGQILGETVAAQLMTTPIILVVFGQFSLIAVVSNLLVVPLIPLAMLLTFIAGFGALVIPAATAVVGWPAQVLLDLTIGVVNYTAGIPWAQAKFSLPVIGVVLWYGVIAGGCSYLAWRTKLRLREVSLVE